MRGLVISISGPDGSGKSTAIGVLESRLEDLGYEHSRLWSRLGYSPGFEKFKTLARSLLGERIPQQGDTENRDEAMKRGGVRSLWLGVAAVDLLVSYGVRVRWSSRKGQVTICDRYVWDALIDRQIYYPESRWVDTLIQMGRHLGVRKPDLSFLLQVPPEVARARSEAKDEPFPDPPELRQARYEAYRALAQNRELRLLDATQQPEAIVAEIVASLPRR